MATLDDLAKLMAAGFRMMRNEMRGHRVALGQVQEAVSSYSQKEQERDALKGKRIADLEADVAELKRRTAQ